MYVCWVRDEDDIFPVKVQSNKPLNFDLGEEVDIIVKADAFTYVDGRPQTVPVKFVIQEKPE